MNKLQIKSICLMVTVFSIGIFLFQSCANELQNTTVPMSKASSNVNTIQIVKFNLEGITHNDFMGVASEVAPNFATLSGLIKKVWLSDKENNTYGGVYSWKNNQSCKTYRDGELYAGALANNPNFINLYDKSFDVLDGPTGVTGNLSNETPTYIQVINFNLEGITHNDFMGIGNDVAPNFAALPGLTSKIWLSDEESNTYGGVYYWESKESCEAYRNGELYAGALTNNPNFANLSDIGFQVLDGPSKITYMK